MNKCQQLLALYEEAFALMETMSAAKAAWRRADVNAKIDPMLSHVNNAKEMASHDSKGNSTGWGKLPSFIRNATADGLENEKRKASYIGVKGGDPNHSEIPTDDNGKKIKQRDILNDYKDAMKELREVLNRRRDEGIFLPALAAGAVALGGLGCSKSDNRPNPDQAEVSQDTVQTDTTNQSSEPDLRDKVRGYARDKWTDFNNSLHFGDRRPRPNKRLPIHHQRGHE